MLLDRFWENPNRGPWCVAIKCGSFRYSCFLRPMKRFWGLNNFEQYVTPIQGWNLLFPWWTGRRGRSGRTIKRVFRDRYNYGIFLVVTGYKWDYTFYKWVISTYNRERAITVQNVSKKWISTHQKGFEGMTRSTSGCNQTLWFNRHKREFRQNKCIWQTKPAKHAKPNAG